MGPRVTILLPTYEPQAPHLREAIESVLAQTEKDWTLFIHDDASTVDVRSMIEMFLSDQRITFEKSTHRRGIGGNWNACLKKADTPIVQFLFQDDRWDARYLEEGLRILNDNPAIGIVSIDHEYIFEGNIETRSLYDELQACKDMNMTEGTQRGMKFLEWWMERGLSPNMIGEPSFVMLRKSVVDAIGPFNETMPQFLDSEYWARALTKTDLYVLKKKLGSFRVHEDGASLRNTRDGRGLLDRYRTMKIVVDLLPAENQKKMREIVEREFERMVEKFFERYGRGVHYRGPFQSFLWKHPLAACRTAMAYQRSTRARNRMNSMRKP